MHAMAGTTRSHRWISCGLLLAAFATLSHPALAAPSRVALVIGISQYSSVPSLTNPQMDADAVSRALRDDGFDVTELVQPNELGRATLFASIKAFRAKATGTEAAVIYYAGHGVEAGGRNYLLPADAKAGSPDEIEGSAIPSGMLIGAVSGASQVRLVILDACRDNPFAGESGWGQGTRSIGQSRGLARETNLPPNVVVLLATQPGLKANDGKSGDNSPFAHALAVALTSENLRISSLPTVVSKRMRQLSGIDQSPDQQGIFDEPDWMFKAGANVAQASPAVSATPVAATAPPAPVETARGYGLVLQSRNDGRPGLLVVEVANNSPFDGTLQPGDVILKLNSATPHGPQSVIGALQQERRASVNVQHGGQGVPTSTELTLPKDTEE
jgi:hypothetical protein